MNQESLAQQNFQSKRVIVFQVLVIVISIVLSFFIWSTKATQNPVFGIVGLGLIVVYGIQFLAALTSFFIFVKSNKTKVATFLAVMLNLLGGFIIRWVVL
ncbi:MAG: hypothetical protein JJ971_11600 [Balneolaceae bacterium]|nr:hypothetical protein [Balneolaceae bacterium]MBO6547506.1 hypothetical protein [Balneolaceae bacterium]MBO6647547.1 hypothetical protein [Balneolaceae bacterium]